MNTTTFTSTINPNMLAWITNYARSFKKTRREVLEEALNEYKKRKTKTLLKQSFRRAANDINNTELSEWGMDDYSKITKSI